MSTVLVYTCEGCGANVYTFGVYNKPDSGFCHTCGFVEFLVRDNVVKIDLHEHLGSMRKLERQPL